MKSIPFHNYWTFAIKELPVLKKTKLINFELEINPEDDLSFGTALLQILRPMNKVKVL